MALAIAPAVAGQVWCGGGFARLWHVPNARAILTSPEKSLQCGRIILPQVYLSFLILNTIYICFGDETDVSNAGEQLARDKSLGDEIIRFNHADPDNNWDSAFFIGLL